MTFHVLIFIFTLMHPSLNLFKYQNNKCGFSISHEDQIVQFSSPHKVKRNKMNASRYLSHILSIFAGVRGQCIEDYECPNAPEDPPMNIEDPGDCTSYILCVGGCAIQMKVRLRTTEA